MGKLKDARREKYCNEYIIDLKQTQAAIRAGYSERSARQLASRLMTKVDIEVRIAELQEEAFKNKKITPESVLEDILATRRICAENMMTTDQYGSSKLDSAAVNGRVKSNDQLGKHLKLFTDKVEHSGTMTQFNSYTDKELEDEISRYEMIEDDEN